MKLLHAVTALGFVGFALAGNASAHTFLVTIENLGPQPLSPIIGVTSNASFDIFSEGQVSSQGIKDIAESGNTSALESIITAGGSNVAGWGKVAGGGFGPGQVRTFMIEADEARPFFSFATMLGRTNDGWLGISIGDEAINLYNGSAPIGGVYLATGADAWDAGSELNTQNAADLGFLGGSGNPADSNNLIRRHDGIVPNQGDSWAQMPAWSSTQNLARVTVTAVPEPATMAAIGFGLLGLARKRKSKN